MSILKEVVKRARVQWKVLLVVFMVPTTAFILNTLGMLPVYGLAIMCVLSTLYAWRHPYKRQTCQEEVTE